MLFNSKKSFIVILFSFLLTGCYELDYINIKIEEDLSSSIEFFLPFQKDEDGESIKFSDDNLQALISCGYKHEETYNFGREGLLAQRDFLTIIELNETIDCLTKDEAIWKLVSFQANSKKVLFGKEINLALKVPDSSVLPEDKEDIVVDESNLIGSVFEFSYIPKIKKIRFLLPDKISINTPDSELVDIKTFTYPGIVEWQLEQKNMTLLEFEKYAKSKISLNPGNYNREKLLEKINEFDKFINNLKEDGIEELSDIEEYSIFFYDQALVFEATSKF